MPCQRNNVWHELFGDAKWRSQSGKNQQQNPQSSLSKAEKSVTARHSQFHISTYTNRAGCVSGICSRFLESPTRVSTRDSVTNIHPPMAMMENALTGELKPFWMLCRNDADSGHAGLLAISGLGGGRMATEKQVKANQGNSKKSTGAKTPDGKAVVSGNALKHGLFSTRLVLGDESVNEFHQLLDDLILSLRPSGALELMLVERVASVIWRQLRLTKAESASIELERRIESEAIREEVERAMGMKYTACADLGDRCSKTSGCDKITSTIDKTTACIIARLTVMQTCFQGGGAGFGDNGHWEQIYDLTKRLSKCNCEKASQGCP